MSSAPENELDPWLAAVRTELGIDVAIDKDVLLDLAREVAHAIARPATPLTTYLVGYAVGRGLEFTEATRRVAVLLAQPD